MNINDLSTQLLYTTVPIYATKTNGTQTFGTGFIFSVQENEGMSIPMLITNYHVLENAIAGFVELHIAQNGKPTNDSIKVQFDNSIIGSNKLGKLDLIGIPLAATLSNLKNKNIEVFFRSANQNMIPNEEEWNNFAAIEDITFIGYPNGLYDNENKISIIRRGITATPLWNQFNGEEAFLIDAGVFPGSSGSPVFIYNQGAYAIKNGIALGNRLFFIGIISQTMLSNNNSEKNYLDLGKVINSKAMYRELEILIKKLKSN